MTPFVPRIVGKDYEIPIRKILEEAIKEEFDEVVVIGVKDGKLSLAGSDSLADAFLLMDRAKHKALSEMPSK